MTSRRPDLSGADVLPRDEGERDALRDRHTEWSRITLGGMSARSDPVSSQTLRGSRSGLRCSTARRSRPTPCGRLANWPPRRLLRQARPARMDIDSLA